MALDTVILKEIFDVMADCGPEMAGDLVKEFQTASPALIEEIRLGLQSNEATRVEHASHNLKSTSGSLGLSDVSKMSQLILEKSRSNRLSECHSDFTSLEILYNEDIKAFCDYFASWIQNQKVA